MLYMNQTFVVQKTNDDLDINLEIQKDRLITKSGGGAASSEELYSDSSFTQLLDFDAYSLIPVNGNYKKQRVKKHFQNDDLKGTSFTNDTKVTQFYFPNTKSQVITHIKYNLDLKDPYFIPLVFTQTFYPIEQLDLRIVVDNDVDIDLNFFYLNKDTLNFTKNIGKKTTEYLWKFREIPAIKYYGNAPDVKWYLPHIMFKIKGYEASSGYQPVLANLNELYNLYTSWLGQINNEDTSALRPIVNQLINGADTDLEKLKRIYEWVQSNVKYIAFSDGMKGLVPTSAKAVLKSRFGDCKGMTNLMYNMSQVANINTCRTWVGSRDIPYTYDQVGSPYVDNHMILSYLTEDTIVFLDATSSETPFGYPTEFIQGKQALVDLNGKGYKLVYIPSVSEDRNLLLDTVYATIEKKDLVGNGRSYLNGYLSVKWQELTKDLEGDDMLEFITSYFQKGDNRFIVEKANYLVSEDGAQVYVEYDFRIPNYLTENDGNLFVNLNLEKSFGISPIEETREIPVKQNHKFKHHLVVVLNFGNEYSPHHVPKNSSFESVLFGYSMKYEHQNENVILDLTTFSSSLLLKPVEFSSWNQLSSQFRKDIRNNVVFKKN